MSSRISTSQIYDGGQLAIARAREKETISAEKANTLKEVVHPSQNPSGWMTANTLKDENSLLANVSKNAQMAKSVLNATETVLASVQDSIQRGHEIAIATAGTDVGAQAARVTMITEARSLLENVIQALNTRFANKTLLGGTKTDGLAFNADGEYLGNDEDFRIEIDKGQLIPINIKGSKAILGEGLEGGVNIIDSFRRMIEGITYGDVNLIRSSLEDFDKGNEQVSRWRAIIGGRMSQIEAATEKNSNISIQNIDKISRIEDADAAKVFSDLARDEAVLKATLATNQKILSEDPAGILFK